MRSRSGALGFLLITSLMRELSSLVNLPGFIWNYLYLLSTNHSAQIFVDTLYIA